ncbi:glycosyltransferase family 2 protein [Spirulina sp. CS-785/01]|uniref:glycosyltransferase family 2 protein n=1 Tax=Spirulina sp. CS-785/01 TaxID=3021716 RepID=UPI002331399A|nr:glycosyltransferase family 2 protein [Spirulina sp. CS-785/01]MDB9312971.1 glycosyltransferase family 2 protein [Spirulina sp. CS-785/01]
MGNKLPLVSIITPTFNCSQFVKQTIKSVQNQTHQNWEMIIVDDCSQDNTANILKAIADNDERIHFIQLTTNVGPAKARNVAIQAARGRFIAFLDSDDLWLPNKLEKQIHFMQSKGMAFSYTQYRRFSGSSLGHLVSIPNSLNYRQLLKNTAIATSTVVINRDFTGEVKTQNQGYDDFILWLSILKQGFTAFALQEDLMRYRVSSNSVSSNRLRSIRWVWNIYRNVEKLNLLDSTWCFTNYALNASWKWKTF